MLSKIGFYHKNQIYKEFLFRKPDYLDFLFGLVLSEISKKKRLKIIQVGAMDGVKGDPINQIITNESLREKILLLAIEPQEKGKTAVVIATANGSVTQIVPGGLDLAVKVKDTVKVDQPLTLDPNVGGFGQGETEIVLQNPNRVKGMIVFFFTVTVAQILLVIKKKQFEKVQAAEMNF